MRIVDRCPDQHPTVHGICEKIVKEPLQFDQSAISPEATQLLQSGDEQGIIIIV